MEPSVQIEMMFISLLKLSQFALSRQYKYFGHWLGLAHFGSYYIGQIQIIFANFHYLFWEVLNNAQIWAWKFT